LKVQKYGEIETYLSLPLMGWVDLLMEPDFLSLLEQEGGLRGELVRTTDWELVEG